jgi:hypothetical protein
MKIEKNNYELFFLDYLDGKLSDSEIKQLEHFLLLNPDLRAELEGTEKAVLSPDEIVYENRDALYKQDLNLPITASNFEDFCIGASEGDLSEDQFKALMEYLKLNPGAEKTLKLFHQLHLSPDKKIVYNRKGLLRRTVPFISREYVLPVLSVAATAAIMLVIYLRNNDFGRSFNSVATEIHTSVSQRPVNNSVTETIVKEKTEIQSATLSALVAPKEKKQASSRNLPSTVKKSTESKDKEPVHPQKLNPSFQIKLPSVAENSINEPAIDGAKITYSVIPAKKASPEYETISDYAKRQFSERILGNKEGVESHLNAWQIADAGLTGINKLTGSKMKLAKQYDENGNLTAYSFNSRLLSFSTTSVASK